MSERKQVTSPHNERFTLVRKGQRTTHADVKTKNSTSNVGERKSMALTGTRKGKMGGTSGSSIQLPPQIENTLKIKSRIRYVSGSDSIVSVSVADLIGSFGGTCTVTNSIFKPWASSCRIIKVEAWPSASTTTEQSANLSWNSGVSGLNRDSEKSKDVPGGVTTSGKVTFRPPKKSVASDWMAASIGSTNVMTLTCNTVTLLDVTAEFTLANQFTSGTQTIATGTLGSIYYLPLDGASSHIYFPVHLPTTF
jgi:hypothetical protein